MKGKKENEKKAQMFHEYRKYELINKNLQESLSSKVTEKDTIAKELENTTSNENKLSYQEKLLELENQIQKLESKKKEISEKEAELAEKVGINELQNRYSSLNKETKEIKI